MLLQQIVKGHVKSITFSDLFGAKALSNPHETKHPSGGISPPHNAPFSHWNFQSSISIKHDISEFHFLRYR